ncbi:MAG: HEAT repeat domain-containing protein, partial [Deltaproteobacteria bacterium]|nr:HEAT repeat domain-containing protein [Deltaproteobacteria bacterium]
RENGNYLEHEGLQRGLLWGIGRLSEKRPELVEGAIAFLLPYLESQDEVIRGLAVRLMGLLQVKEALPRLRRLKEDNSSLVTLVGNELTTVRVKDLAEEALRVIG